MKINDNHLHGTAASAQTGGIQPGQSGRSDAKSRNGGQGDRVDISSFAGQISQSLSAADSSRTAHVEAVAAAVRSGTYRVDSQALSRSIVDEALSPSGGR